MGITEILTLILGVLQFPKAVSALIQLLKKTPQEQHENILKKITDQQAQFEETGRPEWK